MTNGRLVWTRLALAGMLVIAAAPPTRGLSNQLFSNSGSTAPSLDYGNLSVNKIYHYNNASGDLSYVGSCGSGCSFTSDPEQNGQCSYTTDWKSLPANVPGGGNLEAQAQYLGYGSCASVHVQRNSDGTSEFFGRTQCKELTGEGTNPVDYSSRMTWRWLDAGGNVLASSAGGFSFPGTTTVCPNWGYADLVLETPAGAAKFCGQTQWLKGTQIRRDTGERCTP